MRSPIDVLSGRIAGIRTIEIARRTVPCYKYVNESGKESLALCLLVDSKYLYRFPYESLRGTAALETKAQYISGKMEGHRLREFMPGHCRYVRSLPPVEPLDDLSLRQSSALFALYVEDRVWLRRRTDVVEILDEAALRWTRTLELVIPDVNQLAGASLDLALLPVPLALHSKDVLTGFRMVDESGKRLSMLTRREDQPLIQGMLRLMAQGVHGDMLPDKANQLLNAIVASPPNQAHSYLAELEATLPTLLVDAEGDSDALRRKRGVLRALITDLVNWFMLTTWLPYRPYTPVLIEYTFVDSGRLVGQRREADLQLDVGAAKSFHFELVAPDELDLRMPSTGLAHGAPAHEQPPVVTCEGRYLTVWAGDAPRGKPYTVKFEMRLHRPGLAETATWISISATAALAVAVFARFLFDIHPASDVAAPVLVALPAALVALLVREARHRLTARLAIEARRSIGLTAIALAGAAVAIALKFPDPPTFLAVHNIGFRALIWCIATAGSLVVTLATLYRQARW